jgi:hypothetical protein
LVPVGGYRVCAQDVQAEKVLLGGEPEVGLAVAPASGSAVLHPLLDARQQVQVEPAQLDQYLLAVGGLLLDIGGYIPGLALHGCFLDASVAQDAQQLGQGGCQVGMGYFKMPDGLFQASNLP